MNYKEFSREQRDAELGNLWSEYNGIKEKGLKLNMARGVPSPEQLALSLGMLDILHGDDCRAEDGTDCRNYGVMDGIPECKRLMAQVMGVTQSMSLPRRYADAPAAWGVCMDIFPLINCPSPEDLQGMKAITKQIRRSRALVDKYDYRYEGRRTGGARGLYLKLMGGYPNALNERLWRRMERRMLEGKAYEGSGYKAVFDIPNDFMPLPAECFSETTYLPFEDLIVPVPVGYEQLLDLGQELEENENDFFNEDNTRYFHLFTQRVSRLHDLTASLREYSIQIRDLYQSQLDIKQNRTMALLTIITSIFMPLTLIAGWYGMNFRYMPELEYKWAYPAVIAVSVAIVIVSLIFFKKKKWL